MRTVLRGREDEKGTVLVLYTLALSVTLVGALGGTSIAGGENLWVVTAPMFPAAPVLIKFSPRSVLALRSTLAN